jgi:hypothetical protein
MFKPALKGCQMLVPNKTKLVCTIGPSSDSTETMLQMQREMPERGRRNDAFDPERRKDCLRLMTKRVLIG